MVCYALSPGDDESWIPPSEVVKRLREAFAWVDSDEQEGIAYASRILERMKALHAPQSVIDHLGKHYESSIAVAVSDEGPDSERRIAFVVMPEESIKIYTEPESFPLVRKCMEALDYEMIEL